MTTQQHGFSMSQYASIKDLFAARIARTTELESQLAQRFDAADMATAAAQGFRDGVASLSANAGEPRNAIDRDALIDAIAQGLHGTWHCTRVWEAWHVGTMSQDDFEPVDESETPTEIAEAVLALLAAPPTAQAEGWTAAQAISAEPAGATEMENLQRTAVGWQERALRAERNWVVCRRWAIAGGAPVEKLGDDPDQPFHARITELESRLEAIGAGGVSGPLIGQPQAMPDLSQLTERGAVAWAGVDAQGLRGCFTAADMATVSAQGFRDGVASVSAGWISVDERLPEPGNPVLLDIGKKFPIRALWAEKHTVRVGTDVDDWGEYDEETDEYYCPEGWYEWNEHEEVHWAVSETPRAWSELPQPLPAAPGPADQF